MDRNATFLLLFIFAIRQSATLDLKLGGYYGNTEIPEPIRKYLDTFEKRVSEVIDSELKRQLTMLRSRIDYRIPSLLDVTLTDTIQSRYINEVIGDTMIKRVKHLEEEVVLLKRHLEGNVTELREVQATLQESENKPRTGEENISSASRSNTVSIRRLLADVEGLKKNKTEMKVLELQFRKFENITDNLQDVKSELRRMNSSFDELDSEVTKQSKDIQDLELELVRMGNTHKVEEIRTRIQSIEQTFDKTRMDVDKNAETLRGLEEEVFKIKDLCNNTNMDVKAVENDVDIFRSTVNDINVNVKEKLLDLNANILSINEISNQTVSDLILINAGLDTIRNDLADSRQDIHDMKSELIQVRENATYSTLNLEEVVSNNTNVIQDLQRNMDVAKGNITVTSLNVAEMQTQLLNFGETVNSLLVSTSGSVRDIDAVKSDMTSLRLNITKMAANVTKNTFDINLHKSDLKNIFIAENTTVANVDKLEDQLSLFGVRLNRTTSAVTTNTGDIKSVKAELPSIRSRLGKASSDAGVNSESINSVKSSLSSISSQLITVKSYVTKMAANVTKNTFDINLHKSDLKNIVITENTTVANVDKLEDQLSLFGVRLNRTTSAVTTNTGDIKSVKAELPSIRSRLGKASSDAGVNSESINSVKSSLSSISSQLSTLQSGLASTRKDVKFEVRQSAKVASILKGATLKFDKVQYNTGMGYSPSSGQFRAPVAGSYLFWANVLMHAKSKSFKIELNKNGVRIAASAAITSSSTTFDTLSLTAVTELNVGDKVWFEKTHGTTNRPFNHMYSGFGGILIRTKL